MITEDYVSFEVAKLLKEKGFNEFTYSYYSKDDEESEPELCMENLCSDNWNGTPDEVNDLWFSAPTLSMTMKWLREVHKLHCDIGYSDMDWLWGIISVDEAVPPEERPKVVKSGYAECKSYEEACEVAIKYCLENLI